MFKYWKHCLALFTKHQLINKHNERSPDEFCIIIDDGNSGKIAVTPNEATGIRYQKSDYRFAEDIYFVDYEKQRNGRDLAGFFVDIDFAALPDLRTVRKEHLVAIFSIGYPAEFATFDFEFDDQERPKDVEVTHRYSVLLFANDWAECGGMDFHLTLHQHEKYPKAIKDFDGFSGGPVFFCFKDRQDRVQLGFAGMIHLGRNGIVHVHEAKQIKQILEHGFAKLAHAQTAK